MGVSVCNTVTNLHDQELSKHGNSAFPIACYADDLCLGNIPWHWHEEWEIVLVTEGSLRFDLENARQTLVEELTVDQITKSVSVSNSACLRCFHEMLNTTPMRYVMETRLKKAAARLRFTNKSAKDIALDCGFNDTSYFTKMFRQKYDCTPGNYRKLF